MDGLMLSAGKQRRNRLFVIGSSGVGKSTFVAQYVKDFMEKNKGFKLFVFSDVDPSSDAVLSKLNPIRVLLDQSLVVKPIEPFELANSVCIFDDVDSIQDKHIKLAVEKLSDSIMMQGSTKCNIELIVTRHIANDYKSSKSSLTNCNWFVYFPSSKMGLEYAFKKYGFDKPIIKKLMAIPSRWVALHTQHPYVAVYQSGCSLL